MNPQLLITIVLIQLRWDVIVPITDSIRSITIGLDNSMTKSASVTGTLEGGGIAIGTKINY